MAPSTGLPLLPFVLVYCTRNSEKLLFGSPCLTQRLLPRMDIDVYVLHDSRRWACHVPMIQLPSNLSAPSMCAFLACWDDPALRHEALNPESLSVGPAGSHKNSSLDEREAGNGSSKTIPKRGRGPREGRLGSFPVRFRDLTPTRTNE